jgi:hypothetical protein
MVQVFGEEYLRAPNAQEIARLLEYKKSPKLTTGNVPHPRVALLWHMGETLAAAASSGLYPPFPASPPPEAPPTKPCVPQEGGGGAFLSRRAGALQVACIGGAVAATGDAKTRSASTAAAGDTESRRASVAAVGGAKTDQEGAAARCRLRFGRRSARARRRLAGWRCGAACYSGGPVRGADMRRGGGLTFMAMCLFPARSRSGRFAGMVAASGAVRGG